MKKNLAPDGNGGIRKMGSDSRGKEIPPLGTARSLSGDSREVTTRHGHSAPQKSSLFYSQLVPSGNTKEIYFIIYRIVWKFFFFVFFFSPGGILSISASSAVRKMGKI